MSTPQPITDFSDPRWMSASEKRTARRREAVYRRQVLRDLLKQRGWSPATASRLAGFSAPNLLYNFLNGFSHSLSVETVSKLSVIMPEFGLAMLANDVVKGRLARKEPVEAQPEGEDLSLEAQLWRVQPGPVPPVDPLLVARSNGGRLGIAVQIEARTDGWRGKTTLPTSEQMFTPMPMNPAWNEAKAFGVRVAAPAGGELYPDQSILVCVPLGKDVAGIVAGHRVVVSRVVDQARPGGCTEVTVRELAEMGDGGRLELAVRPGVINDRPVPLPARFRGMAWRRFEGFTYRILGIVVASYRLEA